MGKKSKKQLSKAKKMMAEALVLKAEALRMRVEAVKTVDDHPDSKTSYPSSGRKLAIKRLPLIAGLIILILVVAGFLAYRHFNSRPVTGTAKPVASPTNTPADPVTGITAAETWELPRELTEISSNAFVDNERIACVQDNDGIIYIYNLKSKTVESTITFGGNGDYEGLSVVDSTYYVLRADGLLFEVQTTAKKPEVKQYDLPLQLEHDTEPMFYDAPNNRILVGVKEKDPSGGKNKGIYSFDLRTKKMTLDPVMVLTTAVDNNAPAPETQGKKKKDKGTIKPSEIVINHKTGELYILNGPKSEFIIADSTGKMHTIIQLDKTTFPQPEGMCFSPSGELYISSEGKSKGGGIIARVELEHSSSR